MAMAGGVLSHDLHVVGLALALPLAVVALWRGLRVHGNAGVLLAGVIGVALMAASVFMVHGATLEIWLSVAGVATLALAHFWNLRAVRR